MGAEANELKCFNLLYPVNQNEVGLDVAITVIFPVANQAMVSVARI